MFDLNEVPDKEGPVFGALLSSPEGKCHDDGLYTTANPTKVICQLRRGDGDSERKNVMPLRSFLRSKSRSPVWSSAGWQRTAEVDGRDIDNDNEVTVAALDSCSILDRPFVTDSDSAVSLVVAKESGDSFATSPQLKKLGRGAYICHKQSEVVNFDRSIGIWDGVLPEGNGGFTLDSRGIISATKGKRARDETTHAAVDTVIKLKRHAGPAPLSGLEASHGAGPSLSMGINQVAAQNLSCSIGYEQPSGRDGSMAETSLSLGEPLSFGVVRPVSLVPEPNLGLCVAAKPVCKTVDRESAGLDQLTEVDVELEGHAIDVGLRRELASDAGKALNFCGDVPFWRGQLCAEGFSAAHVAAFCSEDLQSTSKLLNLPQVMTVEGLVTIREVLAAVRNAKKVEPVIRVRLLPDAAVRVHSFSAMVRGFNLEKKGKGKDCSFGPDLQLGSQHGCLGWRHGVLDSGGADWAFVATLRLKQSTGTERIIPAKLYLVLGSSCGVLADMDPELGSKLLGELDSSDSSEETFLFGFLCVAEETDRFVDSRRVLGEKERVTGDAHASVARGTTPVALDVVMSKVQVVKGPERLHVEPSKLTSERGEGVTRPDNVENSLTDGIHDHRAKLIAQKERSVFSDPDARRMDKFRVKKDHHSLRYYHIPPESEGYKDRDIQRNRDRDLRGRERDRDIRSTGKSLYRYLHQSSESLFKRDRLKDKELDRFRDRDHHRDFHIERSKSGRERIREQREKERERDRDREKEKESSTRKRGWSLEPDKVDATMLMELGRAARLNLIEEGQDHVMGQFVNENRKRTRVVREDTGDPFVSETIVVRLQQDVNVGSKIATDLQPKLVSVTEQVVATAHHDDIVPVMKMTIGEPLSQAVSLKPVDVEGSVNLEINANDERKENHSGRAEQMAFIHDMSVPQGGEGSGGCRASAEVRADGQKDDSELNICGLSQSSFSGAKFVEEAVEVLPEGHPSSQIKDFERGTGGEGKGVENKDSTGNGVKSVEDDVVNYCSHTRGCSGEQAKEDDSGVNNHSVCNVEQNLGSCMLDDGRPPESLFAPVDILYAIRGHKSGNNGVKEDSVASLKTSGDVPCNKKASMTEAQESQGNIPSALVVLEHGIGGPSLSLSVDGKQVSCEILLEGCDKETRVWLASKQNARYLSEECGVRIVRLEEIATATSDRRLKSHAGPSSVRVFLVTETPADANEAKWFMNQAADILRAIAARGVFAKCLWYQGLVQRESGDPAPSIQTVVKKIKGEDGKNLERIQDETGVMVGIVLDASNKKSIVNAARVIGLRIKGTRKKGFLEATKQLENLLLQVSQQFSSFSRPGVAASQELQVKVDLPSNTSPSSGILTPLRKDVIASYSPVSPVSLVTAAGSPLGSFKSKLEEPSLGASLGYLESVTLPTAALPASTSSVLNGNPPVMLRELAGRSEHSDEEPDTVHFPGQEAKCSRPLYVSDIPERASASMLRELFDNMLRERLDLPALVPNMVLDVRFTPDKDSAFVEFHSDELLMEVLKIYADNRAAFCGLKLELGSLSSLQKFDRMLLARGETSSKGLGYIRSLAEPLDFPGVRRRNKDQQSEEHQGRPASTDSDELLAHDDRNVGRDVGIRQRRMLGKPKPLFLTELMRNASARLIHNLFEDITKKYIFPSLGVLKGRGSVLDVRYIPSRGCAFVDLATSELVECMLDLHSRRPEIFYHMKMEIGRRPVPEDEPAVKRLSYPGRHGLIEESHSYGPGRKVPRYYPSTSSPPRRNEMVATDQDFADDFADDDDDDKLPSTSRKRRSDPERTVYADRLPDSASEGMIRRIFERVLREHMTEEQRDLFGDQTIWEVRYVPTKFCAFVVFVAEEITRLVLQLYNQDEDIFDNMRLKPHFHSRMEDLYREDYHREDGTLRVMDRRTRRGTEDYQDVGDHIARGRTSSAHRAVAATAFKEVDRRRSVYVDRIPELLSEPAMRDLFEGALKQNRHGYSCRLVSQVTFFRDKFDPDKVCSFVELDNEDLVHEVLDVYLEDEDAFAGMRVRPAVKFGN